MSAFHTFCQPYDSPIPFLLRGSFFTSGTYFHGENPTDETASKPTEYWNKIDHVSSL